MSLPGTANGLAFERTGSGAPLLLLHGTNSSRAVWQPVLAELAAEREVFTLDLPAHGQSPASSFTPPEWASEVAALLDSLQLESPAVVGHSSGGWTALELAKLGRARSVLALAPAGLWRDRSPLVTDAILALNWRLGQLIGERATIPLRWSAGRQLAMRQISANPADVPPDLAIGMAQTVLDSKHFPEHFRQTRRLRFRGGQQIPASIPVRIVWGNKDRIARAGSRRTEQLPGHTTTETWSDCGHMLMWDARQRVIDACLAL